MRAWSAMGQAADSADIVVLQFGCGNNSEFEVLLYSIDVFSKGSPKLDGGFTALSCRNQKSNMRLTANFLERTLLARRTDRMLGGAKLASP